MSSKDFCIANLSDEEKKCICEAEAKFKARTGKDCVLIAWEGKDH